MKDGTKLIYKLRKKCDHILLQHNLRYDFDWDYWQEYIRLNRN